MCLAQITKKTTTKKDIKVWKIVNIANDGECSIWFPFSDTLQKPIIYARRTLIHLPFDRHYISGFHAYRTRKAVTQLLENLNIHEYADKIIAVRDYYIPKGTKVTHGIDQGRAVIVSPVLHNPRCFTKYKPLKA